MASSESRDRFPLEISATSELTSIPTYRVRNTWHKPRDWDNIDPESVKLPHSPALFGHDATAHAIAEFPASAERVRSKFNKEKMEEVEPVKDAPMDIGGAAAAVAIAA